MKTATILLICFCFVLNAWSPPPIVYDAGQDFSLFSNPNGPWSYRHLQADLNGSVHDFLLSDRYSSFGANLVPFEGWVIPGTTRGVFHNHTDQTLVSYDGGSYPPGAVWLSPPMRGYVAAVIRFEAPREGHYVLSATFERVFKFSGAEVTVEIERNGSLIFSQIILPADPGSTTDTTATFEQHLKLSKGERFDFALHTTGESSFTVHDTLFQITFVLKGSDKTR